MAAEAKPPAKPMPKLPLKNKASQAKPSVCEPELLEAQGVPAPDPKPVVRDQNEKKEDLPDGCVRPGFVMHMLLSNCVHLCQDW